LLQKVVVTGDNNYSGLTHLFNQFLGKTPMLLLSQPQDCWYLSPSKVLYAENCYLET